MYKNAKHLKGSNVYLKDVTKETAQKQEELKPYLMEAKKEDRSSRFVYDKIKFKGKLYGVDDKQELTRYLKNPGCRIRNNITCFTGELCPLSNLYAVQITIDNENYKSVEHFYQSAKCAAHGKEELASKIKHARSGREAMNLGRAVRGTREWLETGGIDIMTKGVKAKFSIKHMREYLNSTTNVIAEATRNMFWGIGHGINDDEAEVIELWQGSNTMGEILMAVKYSD